MTLTDRYVIILAMEIVYKSCLQYERIKSLMIGDASGKHGQFSDSDKKCAENFGIDYMDVEDFLQTIFKED